MAGGWSNLEAAYVWYLAWYDLKTGLDHQHMTALGGLGLSQHGSWAARKIIPGTSSESEYSTGPDKSYLLLEVTCHHLHSTALSKQSQICPDSVGGDIDPPFEG